MTLITFLRNDGTLDREVEADQGSNLLDVAQAAGQPLEGTCNKQLGCATCHVILTKADFARFGPVSDEEEYMLDLAWDVQSTSRLACQIVIDSEPLTVRIP